MKLALKSPRMAVRGLIVHDNRLLLVNAYGGETSDLMCLPGGGVEPGSSLPDNLIREVHEETGLNISVQAPVLVNEFHDPDSGFHQVEVIFRCTLEAGQLDDRWQDPESIVTQRRWVTKAELETLRYRPLSLAALVWGEGDQIRYDPLETIVI